MAKIVFFCIPAQGHTNPTLGVVRELRARGHEVVYFSYEPLREKIEASGARFIACDAYDCEQQLTEQDRVRIGGDIAFSIKVLVDTTLALNDMVCRELTQLQPDCIVADSMAIWGKAAAKKLGIPLVSSTTTFAFNQYSAQAMRPSLKELASSLWGMMKANKQVRRLRRKGYPFKNALDIISNSNDTETIVFTSPQFQPQAETFSEKYAFVGPSIRPVTEPLTKRKSPLIYISMGTVNNDMLPFYRACIEALRDLDCQAILSVGNLVDLGAFTDLPEHITVRQQVDQIAVLEQADLFLTHCGMNSVSEALYFGVPLVTYPRTKEQLAVAARAEELGAGLRLESGDAARIRSAIEQVLREQTYREHAEEIARGFAACPGAKGAADKILAVCGK